MTELTIRCSTRKMWQFRTEVVNSISYARFFGLQNPPHFDSLHFLTSLSTHFYWIGGGTAIYNLPTYRRRVTRVSMNIKTLPVDNNKMVLRRFAGRRFDKRRFGKDATSGTK